MNFFGGEIFRQRRRDTLVENGLKTKGNFDSVGKCRLVENQLKVVLSRRSEEKARTQGK
jgi:hypothetical protein